MTPELQRTWDVLTLPYSHETIDTKPYVRWFARSRTDGATIGGMLQRPDDFAPLLGVNEKGYDMFLHLNPTHPRVTRRATIPDTMSWAFMLVDIDPLGEPYTQRRAEAAIVPIMLDLCSKLGVERLTPTVVYTGRGVHLWVRLHPHAVDWAHVGDAQRKLLRSLSPPAGFRIDPLGDTARVVRMPGTINHKTGQRAVLIEPGLLEPIGVSARILEHGAPPPPRATATETGLEWQDVKDSLTERARIFLDLGAEEGVRHETCWHVCNLLFQRGVTKESALSALVWGNDASAVKLTPKELVSIVRQVYGRSTDRADHGA